jgi:hypothetical protein
MPLQSVATGEVFTVRVYKLFNQFRYANTYEIVAKADANSTSEAYWTNVANKFVDLEKELHLTFIQIDRVVISSYVPDGLPYNPTSFISIPYSIFGTNNIGGSDIVPANLCMVVRKNVTFGRDGRNFYRGVLVENAVVGGFPEATLAIPQRDYYQNTFNSWYTTFLNSTDFSVCLASGKPNPTNVRLVTNFVVERRIASKKINNRYFKRNPGVPEP